MGIRYDRILASLLVAQILQMLSTIFHNHHEGAELPETSNGPAALMSTTTPKQHISSSSSLRHRPRQEKRTLVPKTTTTTTRKQSNTNNDWCTQVEQARQPLSSTPELVISYPCQAMKPAKSVIVCVLTGGVENKKSATRIEFAAADYIRGVMALGASVLDNINHEETHMLLLVREGFVLSLQDKMRVESVGWTVGTVPNFPLQDEYMPWFPRYKATYSKLTVLGLAEYKCALLIDADALVLGDLRDLMTCNMLESSRQQQHRVAAALDYSGGWQKFNSGVLLWRTDTKEIERLYRLSRDDTFMQKFSSDQAFLNNVYPERQNETLNNEIANGGYTTSSSIINASGSQVASLPFEYNAQTHIEVRYQEYWKARRDGTKILHFTERKGWQCKKRYKPLSKKHKKRAELCTAKDKNPVCNCIEGHLWWSSLSKAQTLVRLANQTMTEKN